MRTSSLIPKPIGHWFGNETGACMKSCALTSTTGTVSSRGCGKGSRTPRRGSAENSFFLTTVNFEAMKSLSGWDAVRCDEHQFRAKIKVST